MGVESSPARFITLPMAVYTGATCRMTEEFESKIPQPIESNRYNPEPDILLDELVTSIRSNVITQGTPLRKADTLAFNANFSDKHSLPLAISRYFDPDHGDTIATRIMENATPVTVTEQLSIALDQTNGDLTAASVHLSVVSRHMARGLDTNLYPRVVTPDEMHLWHESVAGFSYEHSGRNDPAGDTYHFWVAYLTGLSREAYGDSRYGMLTGKVSDFLAENVASATELLRYKLARKKGHIHGTIDILGYHLGRASWALTKR